jgi:hypothetical protein
MKYQTFRTRKEANAEIAKMRGWNAKAIKLYIPDDPKANRSGDVWGWGGGGYVGDGTFDRRSVPVPVCAAGSGPTCTQLNLGTNGRLIAGRDHVLARDGHGGARLRDLRARRWSGWRRRAHHRVRPDRHPGDA